MGSMGSELGEPFRYHPTDGNEGKLGMRGVVEGVAHGVKPTRPGPFSPRV